MGADLAKAELTGAGLVEVEKPAESEKKAVLREVEHTKNEKEAELAVVTDKKAGLTNVIDMEAGLTDLTQQEVKEV